MNNQGCGKYCLIKNSTICEDVCVCVYMLSKNLPKLRNMKFYNDKKWQQIT